MQISAKSLSKLAEMICGGHGSMGGFAWPNFVYRSGPRLGEFFRDAGLPHRHPGSASRKFWVEEVLSRENLTAGSHPHLPSDSLVVILQTLLDPRTYAEAKLDRDAAIRDVNEVLKWDGLRVVADTDAIIQIEASGTGAKTAGNIHHLRRAWTETETRQREAFASFLDRASEDQITELFLLPLFLHLGFERISVAGHSDKRLEFGTDLWMKFTLPTQHVLFFGCQIKKGKIDATAKSETNVAEILNQINMMLDYPILDTLSNRKQLLDHVYIIAGGEITKQARNWLGEKLNASKRRHIIFMDRPELLDLAVSRQIPLPTIPTSLSDDLDRPF